MLLISGDVYVFLVCIVAGVCDVFVLLFDVVFFVGFPCFFAIFWSSKGVTSCVANDHKSELCSFLFCLVWLFCVLSVIIIHCPTVMNSHYHA